MSKFEVPIRPVTEQGRAIVRYVIKRQTVDLETLFDIFAEADKPTLKAEKEFLSVLHHLVRQALIEVQGMGSGRRWVACEHDKPKGNIAAPNGYDCMHAPHYKPMPDHGVRPGALNDLTIPSAGLCC